MEKVLLCWSVDQYNNVQKEWQVVRKRVTGCQSEGRNYITSNRLYIIFGQKIYQEINLHSCLPAHPSVYSSICLCVCPFIRLSVYLSVCPSVCLFFSPSVCVFVHSSVCLSICLPVCLFYIFVLGHVWMKLRLF